MSPAQVLDVGPLARLIEVEPGGAAAWAAAVRAADLPGVVDIVPAARTVLVSFLDRAAVAVLTSRLAELDTSAEQWADRLASSRAVIEIPVRYDGEDLDDVARATELDRDEVIARHTASPFRVDFCGFAPGFAYLRGLDEVLWLPRRSTPRTRVPAGSVAIANLQTTVYPFETPGGWSVIGRTPLVLFDPARDPPSVFSPGDRVRFVAISRTDYARLK